MPSSAQSAPVLNGYLIAASEEKGAVGETKSTPAAARIYARPVKKVAPIV